MRTRVARYSPVRRRARRHHRRRSRLRRRRAHAHVSCERERCHVLPCRPTVQTYRADLPCRPTVQTHRADPPCRPTVQTHRADPPCRPTVQTHRADARGGCTASSMRYCHWRGGVRRLRRRHRPARAARLMTRHCQHCPCGCRPCWAYRSQVAQRCRRDSSRRVRHRRCIGVLISFGSLSRSRGSTALFLSMREPNITNANEVRAQRRHEVDAGTASGTEPAARGSVGQPLLSPADLAAYLAVPLATVYRWRGRGEGPRGYRVGRHVRYRLDEVDRWLERSIDASRRSDHSAP